MMVIVTVAVMVMMMMMDGSKQWQRSIWNDGLVNSSPAVSV